MYEEQMFIYIQNEVYIANKHKITLNKDDDKTLAQADGIATLARRYLAYKNTKVTQKGSWNG